MPRGGGGGQGASGCMTSLVTPPPSFPTHPLILQCIKPSDLSRQLQNRQLLLHSVRPQSVVSPP